MTPAAAGRAGRPDARERPRRRRREPAHHRAPSTSRTSTRATAPAKFNALGGLIVNNLRSPDLIALEEIQDNNGATNDGVVGRRSTTWSMLITAIAAAGGPTYQFRQIDPVDDQDGGEPGGNIRVGFLFRTDRGLEFVDRPGGGATDADDGGQHGADGPQLSFSPGRIDPTNPAFNSSRKPLAGEFTLQRPEALRGRQPLQLEGRRPAAVRPLPAADALTEVQRHQQAQIVNDFVDAILALDPNANVIVLGDLNDFEFSKPLDDAEGGVPQHTLIETLPQPERYTYVFDGNSQALDHILVSEQPARATASSSTSCTSTPSSPTRPATTIRRSPASASRGGRPRGPGPLRNPHARGGRRIAGLRCCDRVPALRK